MSSFMSDLAGRLSTSAVSSGQGMPQVTKKNSGELDMTDFLTLMVTELTNQSIDQTADTSQMLNQLVQMQMVQALVNMTDASVMSYAASLVGKEVTVGQYDGNGALQEVVGTVTGTGSYNGSQVVFIGDKYYQLSEILAVGTLPKTSETPQPPQTPEEAPQQI